MLIDSAIRLFGDYNPNSNMWYHEHLKNAELKELLTSGQIQLGGNANLKIYGTLSCSSGKRMKRENRVFFKNEEQAIELGFRPCGHCLREKYKEWMRKNQVENASD